MSDLEHDTQSIQAAIEALLFVAVEPVASIQLATVLDVSPAAIDIGLKELEENLQGRGLRLQRFSGRVQLTTAPEMAEIIEHFLGLESISRLSRAALETLAVVAYEQPVTRPKVDSIRGVNSDGVVKSLLSKGLIHEIGRADSPGRPILYGTTSYFLQHFGLNSLTEMPALNLHEENRDPDHESALKG